MDIKVPPVGESVFEALIARWLKQTGDHVAKDEPLCELETDKVTLEVTAEAAGTLTILVPEVETVKIGTVIATIDEEGAQVSAGEGPGEAAPASKPAAAGAKPKPSEPVQEPPPEQEPPPVKEPPVKEPPVKEPPAKEPPPMSPSGRKLARELGVEASELKGTGRGGRVTREDLLRGEAPPQAEQQQAAGTAGPAPETAQPLPARGASRETARGPAEEASPQGAAAAWQPEPVKGAPARPAHAPRPAAEAGERVTRKPIPPIRKRIAERLVAARQQTAMLTTFNEADMSEVLQLRKKHGEYFLKRHNVKLGFMSLFVRACCQALQEFPDVNASLEGEEILYHNYCDIGVAIGTEKGLVVPVLRGAESMTLAEIELGIAEYGEKIRSNRLAIADLEGGTFTVSNGGVYGSLLSTPILNVPQSGVLGMHSIQERPVVRDGAIVIRPMMYLALSYDHRMVDGKGAVGFLKMVKELIEEPEEMLLEG
jgi:2-oxoglutarate dehydrogenase E2 component (dihydrolipoamide succinyltransferase)